MRSIAIITSHVLYAALNRTLIVHGDAGAEVLYGALYLGVASLLIQRMWPKPAEVKP